MAERVAALLNSLEGSGLNPGGFCLFQLILINKKIFRTVVALRVAGKHWLRFGKDRDNWKETGPILERHRSMKRKKNKNTLNS